MCLKDGYFESRKHNVHMISTTQKHIVKASAPSAAGGIEYA
jgi:hypothetical protein